MNESMEAAADVLRAAERPVVFTGAGVSAESNIPTFRDDDGFWQRFPPEHYATWRGLVQTGLRRPRELADFVHAVIGPIAAAKPNPAHRALAAAEEHLPLTIITQNIDALHQEAGSTVVHEIHGSLFEIVTRSGRFKDLLSRRELASIATSIDRCRHGPLTLPRLLWALHPVIGIGPRGLHYPKLVLFGDSMAEPAWSNAFEAARRADCVLQIGCSGIVLPAAMLPYEAKSNGATIIVVDPHQTDGDIYLRGKAGDVVPQLFDLAFRLVSEAFRYPSVPRKRHFAEFSHLVGYVSPCLHIPRL